MGRLRSRMGFLFIRGRTEAALLTRRPSFQARSRKHNNVITRLREAQTESASILAGTDFVSTTRFLCISIATLFLREPCRISYENPATLAHSYSAHGCNPAFVRLSCVFATVLCD